GWSRARLGSSLGGQIVRSSSNPSQNPARRREKARRSGGRCGGLSRLLPAIRRGRRGSHRPVAGSVETVFETDNGPSGPSLQRRRGGILRCKDRVVRFFSRTPYE